MWYLCSHSAFISTLTCPEYRRNRKSCITAAWPRCAAQSIGSVLQQILARCSPGQHPSFQKKGGRKWEGKSARDAGVPGCCSRTVPWALPFVSTSFPLSLDCIHVGHEGCGSQPGSIKMRHLGYWWIKMLGVNNRGSETVFNIWKPGKQKSPQVVWWKSQRWQ